MGQHKTNPTAIAAKNGEVPAKKKKMGKRELECLVYRQILEVMPQLPVEQSYM